MAKPLLIVGLIASVRRILVITAEQARLLQTNPEAYRTAMLELGVLGGLLLVLVVSIWLLRR